MTNAQHPRAAAAHDDAWPGIAFSRPLSAFAAATGCGLGRPALIASQATRPLHRFLIAFLAPSRRAGSAARCLACAGRAQGRARSLLPSSVQRARPASLLIPFHPRPQRAHSCAYLRTRTLGREVLRRSWNAETRARSLPRSFARPSGFRRERDALARPPPVALIAASFPHRARASHAEASQLARVALAARAPPARPVYTHPTGRPVAGRGGSPLLSAAAAPLAPLIAPLPLPGLSADPRGSPSFEAARHC